jgi:hypothetical protein
MAGPTYSELAARDPERGTLSHVYEGNFRQLAIKRLPGFLRVQPRVQQLLRVLGGAVQVLEDEAWGVLLGTTLGLAEGEALDLWGARVGEPRGSLVSDSEYRPVIEGRLLANRTDGSVDSLIEVVRAACAPVVCVEYFDLFPAGFQIQVAREDWMGEARRKRVHRILADASPAGRNAIWVEAIHGGFGPAPSCVGNTFTGPLSRII